MPTPPASADHSTAAAEAVKTGWPLILTAVLGFFASRLNEWSKKRAEAKEKHAAAVDTKPRNDFEVVSEGFKELLVELRTQLSEGQRQLHQRDYQIQQQDEEIRKLRMMNRRMAALLIRHNILPPDWTDNDPLPMDHELTTIKATATTTQTQTETVTAETTLNLP